MSSETSVLVHGVRLPELQRYKVQVPKSTTSNENKSGHKTQLNGQKKRVKMKTFSSYSITIHVWIKCTYRKYLLYKVLQ